MHDHALSCPTKLLTVMLASFGAHFVASIVLMGYLRYNVNVAHRGDRAAARKIFLPAFQPVLWILVMSTGMFSLSALGLLCSSSLDQRLPSIVIEAFYCGQQFVVLVVLIFLLQQSVTIPALIRSLCITVVMACYPFLIESALSIVCAGTTAFENTKYVVMSIAHCALVLLYLYIIIRPPSRASKRTMREYCVFALVNTLLILAWKHCLRVEEDGNARWISYIALTWECCFFPVVVWRVLAADTQHWRGLGQRVYALQSPFQHRSCVENRISSQGLHVLIEMHRKFIIDFAYLEIKHKIGTGSSAVVFNGILHSRTPVAIKVYTPTIFSEETVAEFSQEAALCGALRHPNIVTFHGMCVCPPTICLVSELCQGSLDVITGAIANQHQHPLRQQHLINIAYMLDAARAVAYLHSFSPPFVHRDIKPENFVVDANNTVKLTDFGESRRLPKAAFSPHPVVVLSSPGAILDYSADAKLARMTVKGTVDYMAPEVIQGRAGMAHYDEAADVYSLAITLWDVLHPGKDKYPAVTSKNHLRVFELVLGGERPGFDEFVHPALRSLIQSAWQEDPSLRVSAHYVVRCLEDIQAELFETFGSGLEDQLRNSMPVQSRGGMTSWSVSSMTMVGVLKEKGYVNSAPEGVRLGNALMDAGILHHATHERPFDNSSTVFFFDDSRHDSFQPMVRVGVDDEVYHLRYPGTPIMTSSDREPSNQSEFQSISSPDAHARVTRKSKEPVTFTSTCNCRRLAQRLEKPSVRTSRWQRMRHRRKLTTEEDALTAQLLHAHGPPFRVFLDGDVRNLDGTDPCSSTCQSASAGPTQS